MKRKIKEILKEILISICFCLTVFAAFIGVLYVRGIPARAEVKPIEVKEPIKVAATNIPKVIVIETDEIPKKQEPEEKEPEFPECEELNEYMDVDLQRFIWNICLQRFPEEGEDLNRYYASMIGLAEGESTFKAKAYNDSNKNGTVDRGLYQINSCNIEGLKKLGLISAAEDLYDPYTAAVCGDYQWWQCYSLSGWDISSYSRYLYGINKPNKDNKYTQRVWNMQLNWYETIFKEDELQCQMSRLETK